MGIVVLFNIEKYICHYQLYHYDWPTRISMRVTNLWSFRKITSANCALCSKRSISSAKSVIKDHARTALKTFQKEVRSAILTKVFIIVRFATTLDQWIHKTKFWGTLWTILISSAMTNVNRLILSTICWNTNRETSVGLGTKDLRISSQNQKRLLHNRSLRIQPLLLPLRRRLFLWRNLCSQVKVSRIRGQPLECAICCKKTPKIFMLLISKIHPVEFSKGDFKTNFHIISKLWMAQMDNFTWLVEETTKEMTNHFIIFLRFKLQIHITLSSVTPWSIQDTDIQPSGLVRNSSLLPDPEKKKIVLKSNVKCTTQISTFGLKCQISMLVDIITLLAHLTISLFTSFAESPMPLESTSTLLRNTIMIRKRDGKSLKSALNFLVIDKVAVLFRETTKISLFSVDSQVDS